MTDADRTPTDDLVAEEGVNQQGPGDQSGGDEPSGSGTPGAAATEGHGLLDAAPEPNEPA